MAPVQCLRILGLLVYLCISHSLVGAFRPDPEFRPKLQSSAVVPAMVSFADGRLLVGGNFTTAGGIPAVGLAMLLPDGRLDPLFQPEIQGAVSALAVQPGDGCLLVALLPNNDPDNSQTRLTRLFPDGRLDPSFSPDLWLDSYVHQLVVDRSGRILACGEFRSISSSRGHTKNKGVARFLSDGSPDPSFNPRAGDGGRAGDLVKSIALAETGRIYLGGRFSEFNGQSLTNLVRLLEDGSLDPEFEVPMEPGSNVDQVETLPDGRILICGNFSTVNRVVRPAMARLMPDGSVDPDFVVDLPLGGEVFAMRPISDGGFIVSFVSPSGTPVFRLLRIAPNGRVSNWGDPNRVSSGQFSWMGLILPIPGGGYVVAGLDMYDGLDGRDLGSLVVLDEAGRIRSGYPHVFAKPGNPRGLAQGEDGKLYVHGDFNRIDGRKVGTIARLHADGVHDVSFRTDSLGLILCMKPLSGGRLLVGGELLDTNREPVSAVLCLDPNGGRIFQRTLEAYPRAFCEDHHGRLIVVGGRPLFHSSRAPLMMRLGSDGSVDKGFEARFADPPSLLLTVAAQSDDRIVVGGLRGSVPTGYLRRFGNTGVEDTVFEPIPALDGPIWDLNVDSEDRILAAGDFDKSDLGRRFGLVRFLHNGTQDPAFQPAVLDSIGAVRVHGNGAATIARQYFEPTSNGVFGISRVLPDGSIDPDFVYESPPSEGGDVLGMASRSEEEVFVIRTAPFGGRPTSLLRLIPAGPRLGVRRVGPGGLLDATVSLPPGRGRRVVIESSADLRDWTPYAEMDLEGGSERVLAPEPGVASSRFLRARTLE